MLLLQCFLLESSYVSLRVPVSFTLQEHPIPLHPCPAPVQLIPVGATRRLSEGSIAGRTVALESERSFLVRFGVLGSSCFFKRKAVVPSGGLGFLSSFK